MFYQGGPKYSQVEERVVLNEAYISKPLDQVLFQDPFVVFLEKSERVVLNKSYVSNPLDQVLFQDLFVVFLEKSVGVVGSIKNKLLPRMRKNLSSTIQKQTKWEWPFHYFCIMKELNQNHPCEHLLDWLHWKTEFTKQMSIVYRLD